MLNRRILRIKVFKVLYSYAEDSTITLKEALSTLDTSCEATRDLYLFMLSIIPPLTAQARERIETARHKFNPTEEEKNPNMKFVNNALAPILDKDPDFQKLVAKKKFSWEQYDVLLRRLYDDIREKDYYQKYMADPKSSISQDVKLFTKIFEEEFVDNEDLEKILEDMNIFWIDDLAYALTYCCYSLKDLGKGKRWELPLLYQSDMMMAAKPELHLDSDKKFAVKLLQKAFTGYERYSAMVAEAVKKWDKDRLFTTDVVLISLGLAEAENFPEIPVKVSINEYVEISKYYSTPKSRSFVNGLLDRLIQNLANEGKINKIS